MQRPSDDVYDADLRVWSCCGRRWVVYYNLHRSVMPFIRLDLSYLHEKLRIVEWLWTGTSRYLALLHNREADNVPQGIGPTLNRIGPQARLPREVESEDEEPP